MFLITVIVVILLAIKYQKYKKFQANITDQEQKNKQEEIEFGADNINDQNGEKTKFD